MTKFSDLNLSPAILNAVNRMGFEEATPIQAKTIPLSMQGKDLIGQAKQEQEKQLRLVSL